MPGCFRIADRRAAKLLSPFLAGLGVVDGRPILVTFRPRLTMLAGKLRSGEERGTAVHAGSDLRRREIVLDSDLLDEPSELRRIFAHEVYHFVWRRLGNPRRTAWEAVLAAELSAGARGELGWSAELAKSKLAGRAKIWRHYICESFCDTAAWMFSGCDQHDEYTLASMFRERRRASMAALLDRHETRV